LIDIEKNADGNIIEFHCNERLKSRIIRGFENIDFKLFELPIAPYWN
jgi:DNA polymerase III sliding clamp (beta) subunit (PCNA family)